MAGSEKGITALQMDMKITGLSVKTVAEAVNQARPARLHILEKMLEAIDTSRDNLSPHAPRLLSFRIDSELIGTVIGPGGRTIKGITERTNTKIDIEDGGECWSRRYCENRWHRACECDHRTVRCTRGSFVFALRAGSSGAPARTGCARPRSDRRSVAYLPLCARKRPYTVL